MVILSEDIPKYSMSEFVGISRMDSSRALSDVLIKVNTTE